MSLTCQQIIDEAKTNLAEDSPSPYWENADLIQYANGSLKVLWAFLCLNSKDELKEYFAYDVKNLVAGTDNYALPGDSFDLDGVYVRGILAIETSFDKAVLLQSSQFFGFTLYRPGFYQMTGNVYVLPPPEENYASGLRMCYIKVPPTLSGLSDSVSIAAKFLPILGKLVTSDAKSLKEGDEDAGAKIKNTAIEELTLLLTGKIALKEDDKNVSEANRAPRSNQRRSKDQ